jgi:hypothetical protein
LQKYRVRSQESESRIQEKSKQEKIPLNYWLLATDY